LKVALLLRSIVTVWGEMWGKIQFQAVNTC
jgi:hypothetical protein